MTLEVVVPVFETWLLRKHGRLTYRVTQILTGHGCFGEFLCRISKERTPTCWFCHAPADTVDHTVAACPKWRKERAQLVRKIGRDLTLPTLLRKILQDNRQWAAFQRFADAVLKAKEEADRDRIKTGRRRRQ